MSTGEILLIFLAFLHEPDGSDAEDLQGGAIR